jgi:hypothetical protein
MSHTLTLPTRIRRGVGSASREWLPHCAATPSLSERLSREEPERDGRDEQHDLVERPWHWQQTKRS